MTLLQTQTMWNDSVSVSTLPHPISMFLLGFVLFSMIFLFIEFRKVSNQLKDCKEEVKDLRTRLNEISTEFDTKLSDVSKKVDSRVDKAIIALKKVYQS